MNRGLSAAGREILNGRNVPERIAARGELIETPAGKNEKGEERRRRRK